MRLRRVFWRASRRWKAKLVWSIRELMSLRRMRMVSRLSSVKLLAANEEREHALNVKQSFTQADHEFLQELDAEYDILLDIGVGEVFDFGGEAVDGLGKEFHMVGVRIYDLF
jgi:hypothetical protein